MHVRRMNMVLTGIIAGAAIVACTFGGLLKLATTIQAYPIMYIIHIVSVEAPNALNAVLVLSSGTANPKRAVKDQLRKG
jgi:hypothetical protein